MAKKKKKAQNKASPSFFIVLNEASMEYEIAEDFMEAQEIVNDLMANGDVEESEERDEIPGLVVLEVLEKRRFTVERMKEYHLIEKK